MAMRALLAALFAFAIIGTAEVVVIARMIRMLVIAFPLLKVSIFAEANQ